MGQDTRFIGHQMLFNNLAIVLVWAVWCVLEGQTHAACTLPAAAKQTGCAIPHGGASVSGPSLVRTGLKASIEPVRRNLGC